MQWGSFHLTGKKQFKINQDLPFIQGNIHLTVRFLVFPWAHHIFPSLGCPEGHTEEDVYREMGVIPNLWLSSLNTLV